MEPLVEPHRLHAALDPLGAHALVKAPLGLHPQIERPRPCHRIHLTGRAGLSDQRIGVSRDLGKTLVLDQRVQARFRL